MNPSNPLNLPPTNIDNVDKQATLTTKARKGKT